MTTPSFAHGYDTGATWFLFHYPEGQNGADPQPSLDATIPDAITASDNQYSSQYVQLPVGAAAEILIPSSYLLPYLDRYFYSGNINTAQPYLYALCAVHGAASATAQILSSSIQFRNYTKGFGFGFSVGPPSPLQPGGMNLTTVARTGQTSSTSLDRWRAVEMGQPINSVANGAGLSENGTLHAQWVEALTTWNYVSVTVYNGARAENTDPIDIDYFWFFDQQLRFGPLVTATFDNDHQFQSSLFRNQKSGGTETALGGINIGGFTAGTVDFSYQSIPYSPDVSSSWTIDGTGSTTATVSHQFNTYGLKTIACSLSGFGGHASSSFSLSGFNFVSVFDPPTFTYTPMLPAANETVSFTDGLHPDVLVSGWEWHMSDFYWDDPVTGDDRYTQNVSYAFVADGSYLVTRWLSGFYAGGGNSFEVPYSVTVVVGFVPPPPPTTTPFTEFRWSQPSAAAGSDGLMVSAQFPAEVMYSISEVSSSSYVNVFHSYVHYIAESAMRVVLFIDSTYFGTGTGDVRIRLDSGHTSDAIGIVTGSRGILIIDWLPGWQIGDVRRYFVIDARRLTGAPIIVYLESVALISPGILTGATTAGASVYGPRNP